MEDRLAQPARLVAWRISTLCAAQDARNTETPATGGVVSTESEVSHMPEPLRPIFQAQIFAVFRLELLSLEG